MKILGLFLCILGMCSAVSLTTESFETLSDGKFVFIKFFAPWCGHCKKMAHHWERLMDEYKDSESLLVAECDCTSMHCKELCKKNGVSGYPTIKYGDPMALNDYKGAREYEAMKAKAEEPFEKPCSVSKLSDCQGEKRKEIEKLLNIPLADLKQKVEKFESELEEVEYSYQYDVRELEKKFNAMTKARDENKAKINADGFGITKSVLHYRQKQEATENTKQEL